jgi:class 3 adenylate cyclase
MTAARRLAAVLAADVVGYSRLMGEYEAGTARAVRMRAKVDEAQATLAEVMADRTHARSSDRVRRPAQGGTAGGIRQPAGAGAMLVVCRPAGLSALAGHYAAIRACVQFGPTQSPNAAACLRHIQRGPHPRPGPIARLRR